MRLSDAGAVCRPWLAALALAWSVGCSDGQQRAADRRVPMDTVGGVIVAKNGPAGLWTDRERWSLEELFRLGGVGAPREQLFSTFLLALSVGPHGRLFVLDLSADEVRVFDASGGFRFSFGGAGRGPGELSSPTAMAWDGRDRLWVSTPFQGRYTVFDSTGSLVATFAARGRRAVNRLVHGMYFDGRGRFMDHTAVTGEGVRFLRRDTLARVIDTLALLEYPVQSATSGPTMQSRSEEAVEALRCFRPRLIWALAPDGTIWQGRTDQLRLIQRSARGDTLRVVETQHREPRFSSSEQAVVDKARTELDEDIPLNPPALQMIYVLDDGHVLVQVPGEMCEPGRTTDVFDPEGRFLGTMEWPFAMQPQAIPAFRGDTVFAVTVDELDVPYVVRATLHRGDG